MKTLVIHPEDITTEVFAVIYSGIKDCTVVRDNTIPKTKLRGLIYEHDRIICLGHGTEYGLIAMTSDRDWRVIVDSTYVDLLREKDLVLIWCNADEFGKKYALKGFITGMIISEDEEANMFCVNSTHEEINDSNKLFAKAIAENIEEEPEALMENALKVYEGDTAVIEFNRDNFNVFSDGI